MNTVTGDPMSPEDLIILDQGLDWLLCLSNSAPEPEDPCRDIAVRNAALFDWLKRSPTHLRIFWELLELERGIEGLDSNTVADIGRLIDLRSVTHADPVRQANPTPGIEVPVRENSPSVGPRTKIAVGMAAGIVAISLAAFWFLTKPQIYTTPFGARLPQKLSDGTLIELNANSEVSVHYSSQAREVHLIRGEVYFNVQHDSKRPFTVISDDAYLLAVGTEFDVRLSPHSTAVAVVSGYVQASAVPRGGEPTLTELTSPDQPGKAGEDPQKALVLSKGEVAEIAAGAVIPMIGRKVNDVVSWRDNRLEFHQARLAEVAREFNRYNSVQILVRGAAAQDTLVTATLKVHEPEDVLAFARSKKYLSVTQDGNNWIIQARE